MKYLLSFPLLLAFAFAAQGYEKNGVPLSEQRWLKQSAMTIMEDIVPHEPFPDALFRVTGERGHAIWGKLFGDGQIGALVAVKSDKAKANNDAILCLLLWHDGWKFAQTIGTVSVADKTDLWSPDKWPGISFYNYDWNWDLKRRTLGNPYYLICGLVLSDEEHPSWLCDPKSHSLQPTGWPKDAIPSLSGGTITFLRCDKPGYPSTPVEIDEFDGKPGKNLATYTRNYLVTIISMPNPATGKRITWRIVPSAAKYETGHNRYSLCYSPTDENLEPFHEDATVDVQWDEDHNDATIFLVWRLTGIERNAQMGVWDEDTVEENEQSKNMVNEKPARTVVTGIPQAVKAFSWPLNPAPPVQGEKSD